MPGVDAVLAARRHGSAAGNADADVPLARCPGFHAHDAERALRRDGRAA